jgi:hypothetical protein
MNILLARSSFAMSILNKNHILGLSENAIFVSSLAQAFTPVVRI